MQPIYTYTPSTDFADSLDFSFMETYSFQRGESYEANLKLHQEEYDRLSAGRQRNGNLSLAEEARWNELNALVGYTQYLVNAQGQFHLSSQKTGNFERKSPTVIRLLEIMRTEIKHVPRFLCAPTYRDAIVFYRADREIVSVLNVCLSCQYMETQMFKHINADQHTYDLLSQFFRDIGHKTEA